MAHLSRVYARSTHSGQTPVVSSQIKSSPHTRPFVYSIISNCATVDKDMLDSRQGA